MPHGTIGAQSVITNSGYIAFSDDVVDEGLFTSQHRQEMIEIITKFAGIPFNIAPEEVDELLASDNRIIIGN